MQDSKIEWTDHSFNPWIGCTKVSEGCQHCYAEQLMDLRYGKVQWGPSGTRVRTSEANWKLPLKWDRQAKAEGVRRKVFCASLADVFEDCQGDIHDHTGRRLWVDRATATEWSAESLEWSFAGSRPARMDDLRRNLFFMIDATQNLDWLLLTKRPENVVRMLPPIVRASENWFFDPKEQEIRGLDNAGPHKSTVTIFNAERNNVWIGTSVENQQYADERIPHLLNMPAKVRFLSIEPLLGPISLPEVCRGMRGSCWCGSHISYACSPKFSGINREPWPIHWVIVGGESGPGARPMHPDWVRSIRDQCVNAGVPFFFKQWGEFAPECDSVTMSHHAILPWADSGDLCPMYRVGKAKSGRLLDGREWNEFPVSC